MTNPKLTKGKYIGSVTIDLYENSFSIKGIENDDTALHFSQAVLGMSMAVEQQLKVAEHNTQQAVIN